MTDECYFLHEGKCVFQGEACPYREDDGSCSCPPDKLLPREEYIKLRDEEIKRRMVNKLLLLYLIDKYKEMSDIPLTEDRLMALTYLAQQRMREAGLEGFTYEWAWEEDEQD